MGLTNCVNELWILKHEQRINPDLLLPQIGNILPCPNNQQYITWNNFPLVKEINNVFFIYSNPKTL
jgi:hypothetical protein